MKTTLSRLHKKNRIPALRNKIMQSPMLIELRIFSYQKLGTMILQGVNFVSARCSQELKVSARSLYAAIEHNALHVLPWDDYLHTCRELYEFATAFLL